MFPKQPLQNSSVCRRIIGFDTETYLQNGEYKFLSAQFYNPQAKIRKFITDPEELRHFFSYKTRNCIFLAFNCEYDFAVLYKVLAPYFNFFVLYNGGRFIKGKIADNHKHSWNFFDLQNIFPNWSLSKVGELIKMPKIEKPDFLGLRKPKTESEWKYFKKYAMNDAKICYYAGLWLIQKFGTIKLTLPSLSFYVFNQKYKKAKIYPQISEEIEKKLRMAYKGGRSEVWIRGTPKQKIYVYDVVSLYPYIMSVSSFPTLADGLKEKTDINLDNEGVARCTVEQDSQIPLLCERQFTKEGEYKLIFPNGRFTGYFTYPELRVFEALKLGKIIKVHQAFECKETLPIFKEFINDYYKLKQTDKHNSAFWKIFLNSLYGKFGQNVKNTWKILNGKIGMENAEETPRKRKVMRKNVMIAAYITAKARIYMHRLYSTFGVENIVYTDTDSIHSFRKAPETGNSLGKLKFEGETQNEGEATYIRSKFYIFGNVLKCKGLHYLLTANDMRKLIALGNVKVMSNFLVKLRSAFQLNKKILSETQFVKTFTLNPDGKRKYYKNINGKTLLFDYTNSEPVETYGLE